MTVRTGAALKQGRGRLGVTQTQLAELVGVGRRTIAEWEGSDELSDRTVGRLSAVLPDPPKVTLTALAASLAEATDAELLAELALRLAGRRS
jgi:transcriptional regulator with XRE-family HTH domain